MRSRWSARPALTTLWVTLASTYCVSARALCGDGRLDDGETCDDANTQVADGCNADCQREAGYACSGAPSTCCFVDAASAYALLADARLDAASGIITLTPDDLWRQGTAWYPLSLDFASAFAISVRLYLGTNDGAPTASSPDLGADGGSLLFQRDARGLATNGSFSGATGEDGGELGAKGVSPVLGVEFDTYDNGASYGDSTQGDEDHLSVFKNGTNPPSNQLTPATCMNAGFSCSNFEDGAWHRLDVAFGGASDKHLTVRLDGVQRIDLARDLVREVFAGNSANITFGFTANTGGHHNLQRFCPLAPRGFGVPRDHDADGSDDAQDADSDGDGASDQTETSGVFGSDDPDADHDGDGVPNYVDVDYWVSVLARPDECPDREAPIGACDSFPVAVDFDHDGTPDHLDLDSDADGTPDASDPAPRDACVPVASGTCLPSTTPDAGSMADAGGEPGRSDAGSPADAGSGIALASGDDLDGDQVPNGLDVSPSDPCNPNRNALACGSGDADGDHLSNAFECPGLQMCRDTDGDGVSDYADSDSDGDGIPDARECPDEAACPDADGDGTPDLLSPAATRKSDGCALSHGGPLPWLAWVLWLLSVRTSWSARFARAHACGARRSLPWFRAGRRPPPAAPRSS